MLGMNVLVRLDNKMGGISFQIFRPPCAVLNSNYRNAKSTHCSVHTVHTSALQSEPSTVCMAAGQLEDASFHNVHPRHNGVI